MRRSPGPPASAPLAVGSTAVVPAPVGVPHVLSTVPAGLLLVVDVVPQPFALGPSRLQAVCLLALLRQLGDDIVPDLLQTDQLRRAIPALRVADPVVEDAAQPLHSLVSCPPSTTGPALALVRDIRHLIFSLVAET